MEHHPAEAGEAAAAAGGKHLICVAATAIEGKEIHSAHRVPVILLAEHVPIHAEDSHIAGAQGIVVHIHHGFVANIRLHAVPLDPHRQLRSRGHLPLYSQQLIVLAEYRGRIAGRRRGAVQRNGARFRDRTVPLRLRLHEAQRVQHGV